MNARRLLIQGATLGALSGSVAMFSMVGAASAPAGRQKKAAVSETHYVLTGNRMEPPYPAHLHRAVFATGCFWGTEKGFWRLPGVYTTAVGYIAGQTPNPTYEEVCSGRTGHTEAVQVVWDPAVVDYVDLLRLFWQMHDPTQGMGQGNDRGTQYRSAIVVYTPEHEELAKKSKDVYQGRLRSEGYGTITTEIVKGQHFYFAEDYHQQYLAKPGSRQYCSAQPTGVQLDGWFIGRLPEAFWETYTSVKPGCTIMGENDPVRL